MEDFYNYQLTHTDAEVKNKYNYGRKQLKSVIIKYGYDYDKFSRERHDLLFGNKQAEEQIKKGFDINSAYSMYKEYSLTVVAKKFHVKETTLKKIFIMSGLPLIERNLDELKQLKQKHLEESLIAKYGVDNISKLVSVKDRISTSLNSKSPEEKALITKKIKDTKQNRFGDQNYNNNQKQKKTSIERYGSDNFNKTDKGKSLLRERQKSTTIKKFSKLDKESIQEEYKIKSTHYMASKYGMHTSTFIEYLNWAGIQVHSHEKDVSIMNESIRQLCLSRYRHELGELGLQSQIDN